MSVLADVKKVGVALDLQRGTPKIIVTVGVVKRANVNGVSEDPDSPCR